MSETTIESKTEPQIPRLEVDVIKDDWGVYRISPAEGEDPDHRFPLVRIEAMGTTGGVEMARAVAPLFANARTTLAERDHLYTTLEKLSEELTGVPVGIGTEHELLTTIQGLKRAANALKRLIGDYDEERGVIDVSPCATCFTCTAGTVPERMDKGPCALHSAKAAIRYVDSLPSER